LNKKNEDLKKLQQAAQLKRKIKQADTEFKEIKTK